MTNQMVISGHKNVWKSVMSGSKEVMGMVSMQSHFSLTYLLWSYPTQNPWLNFTSKFCLMYKLYLKQPAFRCFQASSQDGSVYV